MNNIKIISNYYLKYCSKPTDFNGVKRDSKVKNDNKNVSLDYNSKYNIEELQQSIEELQYKQNKIDEEDLKIKLQEQEEIDSYKKYLDKNDSGIIVSQSLQKLLSADKKSREFLKTPVNINNSNYIKGTYSLSTCLQKYYKINGKDNSSKNENALNEDIIIKFKKCASETRLAYKFADIEAQRLRRIKNEEIKKELKKKIKNKIKNLI